MRSFKKYRLVKTSELSPDEILEVAFVYDGPMKMRKFTKEEAEKLYQGFFAEVMKSIQNLNKWYKTLPW